ncbi:Site-specific recombinase XerD [Nitrosomonas aestuarii]|uniref:Site-specific recombinase XerD n=1 Tax=Nitrosomonas aestuarii TaxID=52441 RepID=A0A1I4B8M3_9PROT|nr:site-specific integrase [Nitrosomonas aestuarii]SFK65114.1 Site-specific recombinase XerD [Nitrosomonas aestuarii]
MAKNYNDLTRALIRKLPTGKRITEHGITFERQKNGEGVYSINIMVDGRRIHRVIGRESDGTTRTQAEEFIEKIRQDAKHNRLSLPKGRKVALSFRFAVEKYLIKLDEEGGKDLIMKHRRFSLHLVPFFCDIPLSKISSYDIERYKKHRLQQVAIRGNTGRKAQNSSQEKTTSPGTINRELAALSHLFNKAIEWGWIDRRPASIKRFKENPGRITYLSIDQIKRLIEFAKQDQNAHIYPFIIIGLETAMRRMEILSIRREHVNLQQRTIYIPEAKAGSREQPITQHLAQFLENYMAALSKGSEWLFPSPAAKEGHAMDIRKPFRRVVIAAGLNPDEVVRHTLRHTAITHLVQAGVDLPTVKRISGHKTLIMVERYAHQNGEHIKAAMDKLENRYKKNG